MYSGSGMTILVVVWPKGLLHEKPAWLRELEQRKKKPTELAKF
jgi:hypothetical protein